MTEKLYLVRLVLDRRSLARVARDHNLPAWVDDGYFLHAGLSQLFATSNERVSLPLETFAHDDLKAETESKPDLLYVLAYAHEPASVLESKMGSSRNQLLLGYDSRDVPALTSGQRVGFRVRVCPVVRTKLQGTGEPLAKSGASGSTKGRELDAFLHKSLSAAPGTTVQREEVYREWFEKQLAMHPNACTLDDAKLVEFRREVMRRRAGDTGRRIERPNAVLEGTLTIRDPAAFSTLLARGIGRHRAFGFGMLLLRPVSTSS